MTRDRGTAVVVECKIFVHDSPAQNTKYQGSDFQDLNNANACPVLLSIGMCITDC
jgi:hypothetical protein